MGGKTPRSVIDTKLDQSSLKTDSLRSRDEGHHYQAHEQADNHTEGEIVHETDERQPLLEAWPQVQTASGGHHQDLLNDGTTSTDSPKVARPRSQGRPSIFWLLPIFSLIAIAYGATAVPKIEIILSLICQRHYARATALPDRDSSIHDPSDTMPPLLNGGDAECRTAEIQSLVSTFSLWGSLIAGLLSAAISPRLGLLSDRYGRMRMIAITGLGLFAAEAMFVLVAQFPNIFSVNWILLSFVFEGLGGSFIAAMALSYAYASDCTPASQRNTAFGFYHGSLFAGIAIGPLLAGALVKLFGQVLVILYFALACHIIFLVFVIFIVPESLALEVQATAQQKYAVVAAEYKTTKANQTWRQSVQQRVRQVNILQPVSILWPSDEGTNFKIRLNLSLLAAINTIVFGVAMGSMTVILIYTNYMFNWRTFRTSIYVSIVNFSRVAVLFLILPAITHIARRFSLDSKPPPLSPSSSSSSLNARAIDDVPAPIPDPSTPHSGCTNLDLGIIRIAVIFDLVGFLGYIFVRDGNWFTICGVIASFGGMGSPILQSALTKQVPADKVGQVLGAMGLLQAVARVIAPLTFNLIYAQTVGKFDQAVFVCLAATFTVALGLTWFIKPYVHWSHPRLIPVDNDLS